MTTWKDKFKKAVNPLRDMEGHPYAKPTTSVKDAYKGIRFTLGGVLKSLFRGATVGAAVGGTVSAFTNTPIKDGMVIGASIGGYADAIQFTGQKLVQEIKAP